MEAAEKNSARGHKDLYPLFWACLITMALFFLDEGYNDLRWMKEPLNWFWFAVYVTGFLFTQSIVYMSLFWYKGKHRMALSSGLGIPLGLVLLVLLIIYLKN